jgi:hypothetical protein
MPEVSYEHYELAAELAAPVFAPCRLSIHSGNDNRCDRPYLMVMSKGAEDILVKFQEGIPVKVTTFPAKDDAEADDGPDSDDGNYSVIGE